MVILYSWKVIDDVMDHHKKKRLHDAIFAAQKSSNHLYDDFEQQKSRV